MNPLPLSFYRRDDVVLIARQLLGKALFTCIDGALTGGIITETESYRGPEDRASHAYNNRRTARTEPMFQAGGIAYVYTCYGIHQLLNVVTNQAEIPHAILIRAFFPTHGLETIAKRRKKELSDPCLTKGPGCVCQALDVTKMHNNCALDCSSLWIENTPFSISKKLIQTGTRIGVEYAKEDALLPWRFYVPRLPAALIQEIELWKQHIFFRHNLQS